MDNEKIIVTMTSWPARIMGVPEVLDSIFAQSMQPDTIVINLSEEEFESKKLPKEITRYVRKHKDKIRVNWVQGINTKVWKKIIPTFVLYPDDVIICIDDDCLYPVDFIETLVQSHKNNPKCPVTGLKFIINGHQQHCGAASLDKLEYYGDLFNVLKKYPELYQRHSSDTFLQFMAVRNGTPIIFCGTDLYHKCTPINRENGWSRGKSTGHSMAMWNFLANRLAQHL